ncbi:MAG: FAD:protein FMN transferase [Pseudomonadales bacterium]
MLVIKEKPGLHALAFLFLAFASLTACDANRTHQLYSGEIMGTSWSVQISEEARSGEQRSVAEDISALLKKVDQQMSTYKQDSSLSLLNRSLPGSLVQVPAELFEVLLLAKTIHEQSEGAFDASIGPLVDLWGFGSALKPKDSVPSPSDVAAALSKLGQDAIEFDPAALTVRRNRDVELDLSAIAKGYAVDRVVRHLYKIGYRNFLVEVGGELRASGTNKRDEMWTIGIETPVVQRGVPFHAAQLHNKSIATSGDYRNFYELEGVRYSHTLDPRTGRPVTHRLASVTVVHDSAAAADAWATALNVLGHEEGLKLADKQVLAAYFILRTKDGFEAKESRAFTAYNESLNVE